VLEPTAFARVLGTALDAGDVAAVQVRLKDADDAAWRGAIEAIRPVTQARDVALLVNDRVDLVRPLGCDGAHVGQQDMPAKEARRLLGPDAMLGVTCHASRDLAMQAGEDGADYVAFGAFFASATKTEAAPAGLEVLQWWSELMELPCVAIGGITPENCGPIVAAGADFLAVCDAVWNHPEGPAEAVRAFNAAIGWAAAEATAAAGFPPGR
jgi:thiamine-phosphate pyrophosphorylase